MKQPNWWLLVMVFSLVAVMPTTAQTSGECSPDQIVVRISSLYEAYNSENLNSDTESALNRIDILAADMNDIYAECYFEEGEALLETLRGGGYIIYVRHTETDDAEDSDLSTCETQRNLNAQGRIDAINIGAAWRQLEVPVDTIISTEYCRTRETAEMAFGVPEVIEKSELETSLTDWLAIPPNEGTNTIIVGHVDLLETATGMNIPEDIRFDQGDALVFHPLGGAMGDQGYELIGRISLRNWADLARIAEATSMQ